MLTEKKLSASEAAEIGAKIVKLFDELSEKQIIAIIILIIEALAEKTSYPFYEIMIRTMMIWKEKRKSHVN